MTILAPSRATAEKTEQKDRRPTVRAIHKWAGKGLWAITDQGLFALSNFALNILLARWLIPEDYGAFAVAFSIFLLLSTLHTALLSEPMLVFGPGRYGDQFKGYVEVLLREHWKLVSLLGSVLVIAGLGIRFFSPSLAPAVWGAGLAAPLVLAQWLMRRASYARLRPRLAAIAGIGYAILLISGAYSLRRLGALTPWSAFVLMGLASAAAAVWLAFRLNLRLFPTGRSGLAKDARRLHWEYGRWAVGASVLTWIPGNVYYFLLPVFVGLEATGSLRALMNLITPIIHTNVALSLVLLPALVSVRNTPLFKRRVLVAISVFCGGAVLYWLVLGSLHRPVLGWLYAGKYDQDASTLWLLGLMGIAAAVVAAGGAALRAMERPDRVFWAYVASSLVAVAAGIPLITSGGVRGAAIGLVLGSAVTAAFMVRYVRLLIGAASEPNVGRPQDAIAGTQG